VYNRLVQRASPWSLAGLTVLAVCLLCFAEGEAQADDDLVLDLGGTTLPTRHVTHGTFTQGSAPGELGHDRDEEPTHQVTISKDYWIGKFPVTRGQFAKFVADTRSPTRGTSATPRKPAAPGGMASS
jgi:formylglycine-generating enzyme